MFSSLTATLSQSSKLGSFRTSFLSGSETKKDETADEVIVQEDDDGEPVVVTKTDGDGVGVSPSCDHDDSSSEESREDVEIGVEEEGGDPVVAVQPPTSDKEQQEQQEEEAEQEKKDNNVEHKEATSFMDSISTNFLRIVSTRTKKNKNEDQAMSDIVAKVRERIDQGEANDEGAGLTDILRMLNQYSATLGELSAKYLGDVNLMKLSPTAVMYYMEREDEVKNPSFRRRQHRFCPGIATEQLQDLYEALYLANLTYLDTADEIRDGLQDGSTTEYDLAYVDLSSSPGQPANFVAVRLDQSSNSAYKKTSNSLRVVICIRGTKTPADAITDLMCDAVEYKTGKAHAFILESGKYIADKHRELLAELLKKSGKNQIKLTLIGHSLGAGAASIAGMELNDEDNIQVKVMGFGCPALLSPNLAEETSSYITTMVNDSDLVPRLSGIAFANLLLNMREFDWLAYAQRDIRYTFDELKARRPGLFPDKITKNIYKSIEPLLEKHLKGTLEKERKLRMDVELLPPGQCIHFFRDGYGIQPKIVPNGFFSEIDVTRRMIDDHMFDTGYEKSLLEVARQANHDHHFRFKHRDQKQV